MTTSTWDGYVIGERDEKGLRLTGGKHMLGNS